MNIHSDGFRKIVLVVDDDAECGATLELALQRISGIEIVVATTAEGAIRFLKSEIVNQSSAICAVITDLHLPAMGGLEMISWIRSQAVLDHLPILAVSATVDPSTPGQAIEMGATAFFAKPFSPSAVRQRLTDLLAKAGAPAHEETKHA